MRLLKPGSEHPADPLHTQHCLAALKAKSINIDTPVIQ